MLSHILSCGIIGIDGFSVSVEVDISSGWPSFSTVGLPDASVKESKERVASAIKNSGFDFPVKKITVNLSPADVRKEGPIYDLPIAIGILTAAGEINPENQKEFAFVGELGLDGSLKKIHGTLSIALHLKKEKKSKLIIPFENRFEAGIVDGIEVFGCKNLREVVDFLNKTKEIKPFKTSFDELKNFENIYDVDFSDVKGQQPAKRALEIIAAGGHNLLMIGPPGAGKTMLAKRIPTILPHLNFEEAIETTKIYSVSGLLPENKIVWSRPFRSPHHTISDVALVGGGSFPKPGEISLAHNGVLFLDELPEFHRDVLESLRQPLEDSVITVSRSIMTVMFPAKLILIAACNPCPCGYFGHPQKECSCTPYQIQKYRAKISGPLLDRIDLHIEVPALKVSEILSETKSGETSCEIRKKVMQARQIQKERFKHTKITVNAQMTQKMIKEFCKIDSECKNLLKNAIENLGLSARSYDKILKISRTIADLENSEIIKSYHIAEAIQYRFFDKPVTI